MFFETQCIFPNTTAKSDWRSGVTFYDFCLVSYVCFPAHHFAFVAVQKKGVLFIAAVYSSFWVTVAERVKLTAREQGECV